MTHDEITEAALVPLREILQRYLHVVNVLTSAVDALDEQVETGSEPTGPRLQPFREPHGGSQSIEQRHELQAILAFQERLSEVLGVATVTLEGSSDSGFRFLVEMDHPRH